MSNQGAQAKKFSTNFSDWKQVALKIVRLKLSFLLLFSTFMPINWGQVANAAPITSSLDNWYIRSIGQNMIGVTYGNGMYVAVGTSGTVLTSSDGVNWMTRTAGTATQLNGVAYSNGTYVAVGQGGRILTSSDGMSWIIRDSGTTNDLRTVNYINGAYMAVGANGTILTSGDGVSWTSQASGTTQFLFAVNYFNGTYMAVGAVGTILTSSDGASWTSRSSGTTTGLYGVSYANGTYVVVGLSGKILTSSDGTNWTSRTSGTTNNLVGLIYGNGTYVAVGIGGTIVTSSDGVSWMTRMSGTTNSLVGISYDNGTYMAVGNGGTIVTSSDGASWTSSLSSVVSNHLFGISYDNGTYIGVGNGGTIVTSSDGASWTARSSGTSFPLYGFSYGNGTYVAVGYGGRILTSNDGTSWTSQTSGTSNHLYGVTYGNGKYVASGASGTILISSDGLNWTSSSSGITNDLWNMTYSNGTYVAIGVNGTILTSSDGASWTSQTTGTTKNLYGISYDNGTYMVVGQSGTILTSSDGVSWTNQTSGTTNELRGVSYANGTYMAVGVSGTILTSTDGASWTAHTSGTLSTLYGAIYVNSKYVMVGTNGIILQSPAVATVTNAATPGIDNQPTGATVNEGDSSPNLSVVANVSDGGTLSYQWYSNTANSTNGGTAIAGATGTTFAAPTTPTGTTYYYAVVTNTNNSVSGTKTATATSNIAAVNVNALTNAATPGIDNQPTGATVNEGDNSPNLSVAASVSDGGVLSYQWYSNTANSTNGGTAIAGATGTTFAAPTTPTGTTYYYAVVTNTNNSVSGTKTATATSNIAAVNVNALTNAATPGIDNQPTGATVNEGDNSPNLSVAANVSDGGTLSYQWYSNTANSTNGGTAIAGATGTTFAAPTTPTGTTYYYAVVTNTNNSVSGTKTATATSNIAAVNVNIAPTHTIAPIADQTLASLTQGYAPGTQETKTIDVTNTGTSNLSNLQATVSGNHASNFVITQPSTTLMNGATTSAFTVKAKDGLPAGTYTATITLSATRMTDVTFTVIQVVNMPNAPANPQNLVAIGGNGEVTLNWSTVTGATYYNLYMATDPSQLSNASVVTVTSFTYNVQNLLNGTTYFFTVKAGNSGGLSGESNQANATPATVPAAPTNILAVAGNGEATVTFTAPTENGGSPITGYEVTVSPGNVVTTGAANPIVITGLTNGTSYTFRVKAINGVGKSAASADSNAVIPQTPSGGSTVPIDTPSVSSTPTIPEKTTTEMDIFVNGKAENAGTITRTQRNGQTVTTVLIDQKKLEDKLTAEGQNAVVAILVNSESHVAVGSLNGQMVKNMEDKQAVLEIKTDRATYTIPAQQININTISEQVGKSVALQDIQVQIEISEPTTDMVKVVENAAAKGTFTLVVPPLNFTVKGIYGDKTVEVSKFNAYVKRTIAIPDGVDSGKITTGIVVETDGTIRHVPTKIVVIDGKYYAQINSLTNSTYSLVYHPLEFEDMANHWAKQAVGDMGSRMVIDGTGNGMFSPDRDITRAEFAAIIVRALGLKTENGATPFSDVQSTDWYSSVVNTAYAYHLIGGFEDGTFRPMDRITREQAMVILSKAMAVTSLKGNLSVQTTDVILRPYGDTAAVSAWALSSVADTVEAGIVSGRSGNELAPKDYITRAEVAKIIQGLLQKSGLI
ncbi:S-layer homology domain-containing protein [Paenibacillus amylolyticus]|uniref:S-layer homology domain-containing protein n=1 Tax=Paenibacillus amylolyticus TaxID=1451 RepID=UPI001F02F5BD|nr:S-layer homology domain-containing protein [Paenibacillus amylolyticus]